jgi:hypothetical protein
MVMRAARSYRSLIMSSSPSFIWTGEVVAVHATSFGFSHWHVGAVFDHPTGTFVASKRPRQGGVLEPYELFAREMTPERFFMWSVLARDEIERRMKLLLADRGYTGLTDNCEHGLMELLGWQRCSPQVASAAKRAAGGAVVGAAAGALLAALFDRSPKAGAAAGAGLGSLYSMSRVASLRALYEELGLLRAPSVLGTRYVLSRRPSEA